MKTKFLAILLLFFISCSEDDQSVDQEQPTDYASINDQQIRTYLERNNLEAEKTDSGLYYIIEEEGTGVRPMARDEVKVAYKGYFTTGQVFDESSAEGIVVNLQEVIKGWTEGLTYFKEGGSGILLVPAHLAYGSNPYRGIPGGSVLIFEIELLDVIGE